MATTNLIAAAVQEDKDDYARATTVTKNAELKTTNTLITALKLALFVGSIVAMISWYHMQMALPIDMEI